MVYMAKKWMSELLDKATKEVDDCASEICAWKSFYSDQVKWRNKMTDCMSRLKSCEGAMKAWDKDIWNKDTMDMVFEDLIFVQDTMTVFIYVNEGI